MGLGGVVGHEADGEEEDRYHGCAYYFNELASLFLGGCGEPALPVSLAECPGDA